MPDVWTNGPALRLAAWVHCSASLVTNRSGYYITSLRCGAKKLAGYVRGHWGFENGLHWVLDVSFREDDSRTRAGQAAANLAMLRRVAVSLLRRAGTKGSIKARRMKAGWDDDYLLQVLQGITAN